MESRRRERVPLKENVICEGYKSKVEGHDIKTPFEFEIQDLSYGGMRIQLAHLLHKYDHLEFKLSYGRHQKYFVGEVQWCKIRKSNCVSGVQFVDLTRDDVIFLYAYLKSIT